MYKNIPEVVEHFLEQNNMNIYALSKITKINRGIISDALNESRHKTFSLAQVDILTKAMNLPEGALYNYYVDDCIAAIHWRRVQPFLMRCAELSRFDCLERILPALVEDIKNITWIFTTAEDMYNAGYTEAAAMLYQYITEVERSSFSEKLATSYYRLFKIYRSSDEKGFQAAMQFIPYRHRLPIAYSMDGLIMLADAHAIRGKWEDVAFYADELSQMAEAAYRSGLWKTSEFKLERPLVYYYAQGFLYKACYYEEKMMLDESKKWIAKYADLSWFGELDEAGKVEVERFKMFAKGNTLLCDVKAGDRSAISEYVAYLQAHPSEVLEGLIAIIDAAIRHDISVDTELELFSDYIHQLGDPALQIELNINYKESYYLYRQTMILKKLAIYSYKNQCYTESVKRTLQCLKLAIQISDNDGMVNSTMGLFEMNRDYSTKAQQVEYTHLCREVCKKYEAEYELFIS